MRKERTARSTFDFWKAFPLMDIIGDAVISKRGDITLGWELTLPDAFSMVGKDYDEMVSVFASAVRALPDWTMLHRQDVFTYEDYHGGESRSFLGSCYESHFDGRRHPVHSSRLFLTMTSRFSPVRGHASCGLLGIGALTQTPTAQETGLFRARASEFISIITSSGRITARPLSGSEYLEDGRQPGLIHSYLSLFGEGLMLSDVIASRDCIRIGDRYASAYAICESDDICGEVGTSSKVESLCTASSEVLLSFGSSVGLQLDCEHMVNQYVLVCPQADVLRNLDAKRRRMDSMPGSAENRVNSAEIQKYIDATHRDSLTTVKAHVNVIAWGPESLRLDIKGKVSSALTSMGITGSHDLSDTETLWYAGIPGAAGEIGADNLMTMELCSALCPGIYETFPKGMGGGMLKLCERLSCSPVTLDIQKEAQRTGLISNYNAFILGGSGSGKSFFTNHLLRSCYDAGESVFFIDVGDSYRGLCSAIHEESGGRDGFYYTWDSGHPLSFPVFNGIGEWVNGEGVLQMDSRGVSFFLSFLKTVWQPKKGWRTSYDTILCQIIRDFAVRHRSMKRRCIFEDFARFVSSEVAPAIREGRYRCGDDPVTTGDFDVKDFTLALSQYRKGAPYGFLLNDMNPKDLFSSRFTVFEVDRIKDDGKLFPIVILCIMNAFDDRMRRDGDFKVMAIDEAWIAIANETMAPYLAGLWKTSRKYSTSAIVITQQMSDIMNSPVIRDTILQNSSVKILLAQDGGVNFESVADLLALDDRYRGLVLSMNRDIRPGYRYKEVFIKLGDSEAGVWSTEVSPEEAAVYESEIPKKAALMKLAEETGSFISAVRRHVSEKDKQFTR